MFKVLIVDDEKPVLDGIGKIIERHFPDLHVAATAQSGRMAVEKAWETRPDLVLMDVNLPGISGLDAIRSIRERLPDTLFVLITAYERFDIAKEAFDLEVSDYLLKPVRKDDILAMLEKILLSLRAKERTLLSGVATSEKVDIAVRYLAIEFFRVLQKQGLISPEEYKQRLKDLGMVLDIGKGPFQLALIDGIPSPECLQSLSSALSFKHKTIPAYLDDHRVGLLFTNTDQEKRPIEEFEAEIIQLVSKITGPLPQLRCAIGTVQDLENLANSYREAKHRLNHDKPITSNAAWQCERELIDGILYRSLPVFANSLQSYVNYHQEMTDTEQCRQNFLRTASHILHGLIYRRPELADKLQFPEFLWTESSPLLASKFIDWATDLGQIWSGLREGRRSPVIEKTLTYLQAHWHEAVSLEDAARYVQVSPQYLSRLFSEEMHETFVDYLTTMRMEHARTLLSQGKSIKVVSHELGYSDPNYFGRLFKKVTGVTPSDFARTFA